MAPIRMRGFNDAKDLEKSFAFGCDIFAIRAPSNDEWLGLYTKFLQLSVQQALKSRAQMLTFQTLIPQQYQVSPHGRCQLKYHQQP